MTRKRHPFEPLATLATRLFGGEAGAGILLTIVAAAAILLANSPLSGAYHGVLHAPLPWTPIAKLDTLHLWINDAAMALFFAALFDAFDGRIARLTKTQSDFGVQMDSLADIVNFGVAPALVLYLWSLQQAPRLGPAAHIEQVQDQVALPLTVAVLALALAVVLRVVLAAKVITTLVLKALKT